MNNYSNKNMNLPKAMVFIDAEYVIKSLRETENIASVALRKIDWNNLITFACKGLNLIRTYYYTAKMCKSKNNGNDKSQRKYLKLLKESIPYIEIKKGKLIQKEDSWVQKGVDVMLAVDLVMHASMNHFDTAVVIADDYDFKYAIEQTKDLGKQVILYTFDRAEGISCEDFIHSADVHNLINAETIISNVLVKSDKQVLKLNVSLSY